MKTIALMFIYNVLVMTGAGYLVCCLYSHHGIDARPWCKMAELVTLIGAFTGCIHGLASIGWHAGNGAFDEKWNIFYLSRPFVGAGMAFVTWLVLAGGLGGFEVKSEIAILAWAALAGLYSQPALDKLKDLFATIFKK